jgi:hypothetical protein
MALYDHRNFELISLKPPTIPELNRELEMRFGQE